jgi:putative CocE/NonD family hydrolase
MGGSKKDAWRTSNQWPLPNQKPTRFYFDEGKTGSIASINDGFLRAEPRGQKNGGGDAYTVDYSTTSGKYSRWYAVNWSRNYPDMRSNDQKALTYTTSPLETEVEVTGHPVAHLWLTMDAPDLDVFVYLEEVDGGGRSTYITEGILRASHRQLSKAPYNNLGLPYHSHYKSDLAPIPPGEPVELVFDLLPTSYLFRSGHRIRIAVTCADADNFETPTLDPAPKLRLLRDTAHASFVEFPIIPGR